MGWEKERESVRMREIKLEWSELTRDEMLVRGQISNRFHLEIKFYKLFLVSHITCEYSTIFKLTSLAAITTKLGLLFFFL